VLTKINPNFLSLEEMELFPTMDRELFRRLAEFRENRVVGLPTRQEKIVNMKNSRDLFVPKVFSSSKGNIGKMNKSKNSEGVEIEQGWKLSKKLFEKFLFS
jgi:hypothetical protein